MVSVFALDHFEGKFAGHRDLTGPENGVKEGEIAIFPLNDVIGKVLPVQLDAEAVVFPGDGDTELRVVGREGHGAQDQGNTEEAFRHAADCIQGFR